MVQPNAQTAVGATPLNGVGGPDARLRHLFAEQQRLRELLDRTRADAALLKKEDADDHRLPEFVRLMEKELEGVNAELFRFQDEYCTDTAREEEYNRAVERILGFDPRVDLKEVEAILAGKRGCDMREFLEELERTVGETPAQGAP